MTLNQLSYFYQAAVLEHFNQAAEKMNITEPSLSRSIAALEDELGVTLFEKRGRNVILTKAGEIFFRTRVYYSGRCKESREQNAPDCNRWRTHRYRLRITSGKGVYPNYRALFPHRKGK